MVNPKNIDFPEKAPFFIEILGDLPYYLPIPDNMYIKPSLIGAEPFFVAVHMFRPLQHPDQIQGENIDDRLGTYARSRARVLFPKKESPNDLRQADYEAKAYSIVNRLVESVRYVTFDSTMRRILSFDKTIFRIWKLNDDGTVEPVNPWVQRQSFGPFGVMPMAQLTEDAFQRLVLVFNGISRTNPAWHLVLDAQYHNQTGDIARAILDLGTALEINIPTLIEQFPPSHSMLQTIDIEVAGIYQLYGEVLEKATGHSLHEEPRLFAKLEYIRAVRNSVTHDWNPTFKITKLLKQKSKYLHIHEPMDGHVVDTKEEVDQLINDTIAIIRYTSTLLNAEGDAL